VTTRAGSGRIAVGSRRGGMFRIQGEDLQPLKARILLMLALAHTKDAAQIQRMFSEY
jgi:L-asparaginase/Glu-tRNA(Gln) amidotransferase subunit D